LPDLSYKKAEQVINSIEVRYESEFKEQSKKLWAAELSQLLSPEEIERAYQAFKKAYESLPYRFSVSAGLLKQLKPTFTTATVEERLYSALNAEKPAEFLKAISEKLYKLVCDSNLFDKSLTAKDLNFTVKDVARRFIEWNQNKEKGILQPEPEPRKLLPQSPPRERTKNPFSGMKIKDMAKAALKQIEARKNAK
jgi:hypothetical protein